jgi:cytosine/creatinine deaminase
MADRHVLARARLPDGGDLVDIEIAGRRIAAVRPAGVRDPAAACTDLAGGMVWPGFVDLHTHLDKGHIWPRAENEDGSFAGALAATGADRRARWTASDVERRFSFGLRCAYAHGTVAIRTHLDSLPPQHRITWPVFAELRAAWAGRIDLQGVAIIALAALDDPAVAEDVAACVAAHNGIMGAVIHPMDRLAERIEALLRLCMRHGLGLDVHIDETLDPMARSLPLLAEAALRTEFPTPIVVGHCCSLTVQDDAEIDRTLELMQRARLQVVSLPMCNMFLQDRAPGRTPRWRGVTLLHEMAARGIPVAVASDNCRDPFYAYGDHDLMEVFREAVRIAQLDRPFGAWHHSVTSTPASIMGIAAGRIAVGAVADLVLFRARSMNELLARPQSDRVVLRGGVPISARPPDYAELDDLYA